MTASNKAPYPPRPAPDEPLGARDPMLAALAKLQLATLPLLARLRRDQNDPPHPG